MRRRIAEMLAFDIFGSLFLGASIVCFAVQANFAPGGVNGLAVMSNYLFSVPIGLATVLINIPIILLTFRKLGKEFFIISVKTMLISSLLIDYVLCYFPVFTGSRLAASILSGITSGILWLLAFFIDGIVIVLSVFVFREVWSFVYGAVYTVITSLAIDGTTYMLKRTLLRKRADQV